VEKGRRDGTDAEGRKGGATAGSSTRRDDASEASALLMKIWRRAVAELKRHCEPLIVNWPWGVNCRGVLVRIQTLNQLGFGEAGIIKKGRFCCSYITFGHRIILTNHAPRIATS
jgi:hypothetical protein